HYAFLHGARHNALVLVVIMAAGALIRHSFVARHKALVQRRPVPWGYAVAGCAMLAALMVALAPAPSPAIPTAAAPSFAQVREVIERRCVVCHNVQVVNKDVQLHTPALIAQHAQRIYQQAVVQRSMPLNNATQMSD